MNNAGRTLAPLLIEWSPNRVRAHDPITQRVSSGKTIGECVQERFAGRDAIIGIAQRSAFIRSLSLPSAARSEIGKVIQHQLALLLPLQSDEYVFGFRVRQNREKEGCLVVVGAVKTESLRKIYSQAAECGLNAQAVLPLAFGSWLAAREKGISECIVVESEGDVISLDVIHDGEICYSRTIPQTDSPEALQDEVARTFKIAGVPESPVFSTGRTGIHSNATYEKEAIAYLGDPGAIAKSLFTIELPETVENRRAKAGRWKSQRAVAAAALAVLMGAFAVSARLKASAPGPANSLLASSLKSAQKRLSDGQIRDAQLKRANAILEVAFSPGQAISDVVSVLSNSATKSSWFTSLAISRGAPVSISGLAMGDSDVAKLVAELSKNPRFEDMKVISSSRTAIGDKPVTQFLVLGKLKGLLAFDRPFRPRKGT